MKTAIYSERLEPAAHIFLYSIPQRLSVARQFPIIIKSFEFETETFTLMLSTFCSAAYFTLRSHKKRYCRRNFLVVATLYYLSTSSLQNGNQSNHKQNQSKNVNICVGVASFTNCLFLLSRLAYYLAYYRLAHPIQHSKTYHVRWFKNSPPSCFTCVQ